MGRLFKLLNNLRHEKILLYNSVFSNKINIDQPIHFWIYNIFIYAIYRMNSRLYIRIKI